MVFNRVCAGHDGDRAGRDLRAAVIGGVPDRMRAGGSRRTVDHPADFAGRILGRRADRAGHSACGIERAVGRGLKGKSAGCDLRGGLDCRGKLAAVELDVGFVLAERHIDGVRIGNRDGEFLRAGVLVAVDGRLSGDGDLAAALDGEGDAGAGGLVQRADAGVADRPGDGVIRGSDVGILAVEVLLRGGREGDRVADLD